MARCEHAKRLSDDDVAALLHTQPAASGATDAAAARAELTRGPCTALALCGKDAVAVWAALLGPLDPHAARVRRPGSLRARFGLDAARPLAYGSLSEASARAELRRLFPRTALAAAPTADAAAAVGVGDAASAHQPRRAAAAVAPVMDVLTPALTPALVALCRARPPNPIEWLAAYLLEHKPASKER